MGGSWGAGPGGDCLCPNCGAKGQFTKPMPFKLMFETQMGANVDDSMTMFLRPETAQGIFAQFGNVHAVSRQKIPFGIAQIGKAFRNEVVARNFIFRIREFEQMEIEYFIHPKTDWEPLFADWLVKRLERSN